MKIDSREIRAVQSTEETASQRYDIYAPIHKALRSMMSDTLLAMGRADGADAAECRAAGERVLLLADTCQAHLEHESDFVHPAMEARAPGSSAHIADDHVHHLAAIAGLRAAVAQMNAAAEPLARTQRALALYRQLALFVADNFQHMQIEETEHNAVLRQTYTDAELAELEQRIVASQSPTEAMGTLRWMVPALPASERLGLLRGMQAGAPAEVFAAALGVVRPHLGQNDWDRLAQGLGVAA